jgi:hypothetical protein
MHELGIPLIHKGRDNSGGSAFSESERGVSFEAPWAIEAFVSTVCNHAGVCIDAKADDQYPRRLDMEQFLLDCLAALVELGGEDPRPGRFGLNTEGHLKNPGSHPGILARNAK